MKSLTCRYLTGFLIIWSCVFLFCLNHESFCSLCWANEQICEQERWVKDKPFNTPTALLVSGVYKEVSPKLPPSTLRRHEQERESLGRSCRVSFETCLRFASSVRDPWSLSPRTGRLLALLSGLFALQHMVARAIIKFLYFCSCQKIFIIKFLLKKQNSFSGR